MEHHDHHHHEHHDHHEHHGHAADVHSEHCGCGCGGEHSDSFELTKKKELAGIILSALLFAAGWITEEFSLLPEYITAIFFAAAFAIVGIKVVREALEEIAHKNFFGECLLISVVSIGAFIIGEYSEGAAVMLLWSIGEFIQGSVLSKSRAQIRALSDEHGFEHAHANSDTERFISRFARVYTPLIFLLALLVTLIPVLFWHGALKEWVHRGLSALVIGCPCAIVISVPMSFSCAIGACTRQGIFVHCSDALEHLHKTGKTDEIIIPDGSEEKRAFAKRAADKAVRIATENIVTAIGIKLVVLVLVIFLDKEVPMWLAEFSDAGVAILAILNALRAMRVK